MAAAGYGEWWCVRLVRQRWQMRQRVMVVMDELQAKISEYQKGAYLDYFVRTHSITHTRTHPVMMKAVF